MKLHSFQFSLLLLLIFIGNSIFSQDSTSVKNIYYSDITIEIGGVGFYGSINYEHLIYYSRNEKFLLRTGLSYLPLKNYNNSNNDILIFPVGLYYLSGNNRHLEVGLNSSICYQFLFRDVEVFLSPSVGFKSQKFQSKSISFSLAFSPVIGLTKNAPLNYKKLSPWLKIGMGYNFNSKKYRSHTNENYNDSINKNKRFYFEFGSHFLIGIQSNISKFSNYDNLGYPYNSINNPIDTSKVFVNSLIVNRRFFPTFAIGMNSNNNDFKVELTYFVNESAFSYSEDFGKSARFDSEEFYFLFGYSYTGLAKRKNKLNLLKRFYIGANFLYQHKERALKYHRFNAIGGCPCDSEDLNSHYSSNHFSLIPDLGIKFAGQQKFYLKIGMRLNSITYITGKFWWNYELITGNFPPITTYNENSGNFSKFLYTEENKYFSLVDHIYFKVGFKF